LLFEAIRPTEWWKRRIRVWHVLSSLVMDQVCSGGEPDLDHMCMATSLYARLACHNSSCFLSDGISAN